MAPHTFVTTIGTRAVLLAAYVPATSGVFLAGAILRYILPAFMSDPVPMDVWRTRGPALRKAGVTYGCPHGGRSPCDDLR
jgi:glucokinase